MFKIVRNPSVVEKMYTLHGFVGDPSLRNDRYIQRSWYTGKPVINTRCGYRAGDVVCFTTKKEAYDFITNYMSDPRRKVKYHINWKVIEYRPQGNGPTSFAECMSEHGTYYTIYSYRA